MLHRVIGTCIQKVKKKTVLYNKQKVLREFLTCHFGEFVNSRIRRVLPTLNAPRNSQQQYIEIWIFAVVYL